MRGFLAIVAVIGALALSSGEAWSLSVYTIAKNSGLFKKQGCGGDPTGCTWCGKSNPAGSNRCYSVTSCKGDKCSVVAVIKKQPTPKKPKGPSQAKPVSVSGTTPPKANPTTNLHPVESGGSSKKSK